MGNQQELYLLSLTIYVFWIICRVIGCGGWEWELNAHCTEHVVYIHSWKGKCDLESFPCVFFFSHWAFKPLTITNNWSVWMELLWWNYIRCSAYIEVCQHSLSTLSGRGVLAISTVPMATLLTNKETGGVLTRQPCMASCHRFIHCGGSIFSGSFSWVSCSPLQGLSAFGSWMRRTYPALYIALNSIHMKARKYPFNI